MCLNVQLYLPRTLGCPTARRSPRSEFGAQALLRSYRVVMRSLAISVDEYINELPPERREVVSAVRKLVLANLPAGIEETMSWGMISYEVPLTLFPKTYNDKPLVFAALAAQKQYYALYLMGIYGSETLRAKFEEAYQATGKRMDIGKSCVRFRTIDDLPLDVIAEAIAAVSLDEFCAMHQASQSLRKSRKTGREGK